jgi:beta-phosphoglucomutase
MTIKGLLFDLDGVIVSTEQNHYVAWKRTADELGINFGHKENEQLKGLSRVDSLKAILALSNKTIDQDYFDALLQTKNEFYLQSIQTLSKADLLPGVLALLEEATKREILLGVGSSSKNAPFILDLLGITSYFKIIVDGTMVDFPKPHPEVFLKGAEALGIAPQECIVFEDASSGIQAAKAGGFYAIAVGNKEIEHAGDAYLTDLTEFKF